MPVKRAVGWEGGGGGTHLISTSWFSVQETNAGWIEFG